MRKLALALTTTFLLTVLTRPAFATDSDGDGLPDAIEATLGTDPNDADSDDDDVSDGDEVNVYASDPLDSDTDDDNLSDGDEVMVWLSDPCNTNTDGDNWNDGAEVLQYGTSPTLADTDGDTTLDHADANPTHAAGTSYGGSTAATFAGGRTGLVGPASGQAATDGVGVLLHEGSFQYDFAVGQAKGVAALHHALGLHYDSQSLYDGAVGIGWTSVLDTSVAVNGAGDVTLSWAGGQATWTKSGAVWTPPTGFPGWDCTEDAGIYSFTWHTGGYVSVGANGITALGDRFGNTITYDRTGATLTSITDSRGEQHDLEFYTTGRLKKLTMADGAVWEFRYNTMNQLWKVLGPATTSFPSGITTEFRYSNGASSGSLNSNMVGARDGRGQWWLRNVFDSSDRVVKQFVGGASSFRFDHSNAASSHSVTVTDRAGNERVWTWHATKLTKESLVERTNRGVRAGEGDHTTTWTTDSEGYVVEVEYPRGNGVEYTLNAKKLPTQVRRKADVSAANGATDLVEETDYDATRYYAVTRHEDAEGHETTYTVDTLGRCTQVTHPTLTHVTPNVTVTESYTWNSDGTLATATDGEGAVTQYTYVGSGAKKGRLATKVVDHGTGRLNLTTSYDYEDWGDVKSVTDPNGNTTTYTVERYGNVEKIEAPSSLAYVTEFDHDGNLNVTTERVKNVDFDGTWLSSPQWWTTTTTYTIMDRVATVAEDVSSSLTRTTLFEYTANDLPRKRVRGGIETATVYDERDLVYEQRRVNGGVNDLVTTLAYDGNRNLVEVVNPRGKTSSFEFDLFDRRTKATDALGNARETDYDEGGHVTETRAWQENGTTDVLLAQSRFTYDAMHRRWKEEAALLGTTTSWLARTVVHDKCGRVTRATDRRGHETVQEWDAAGRRLSVTDELGNVTANEYDDNGNVVATEETEVVPGSTTTETYRTEFEYDAVNRMKKQTLIDRTSGTNTKVTEWKRGAIGLRRTVDPLGNEVTFTLDGLGRTTQKHEDMGSGAAIVTTWEHDDADHVTKLTDDNGSDTLYAYDVHGRLSVKTYESTKTVTYTYDDNGNVVEVEDQNGTLIAQGYDDLDRLIGRDITPASGVGGDTTEDFAYDALGRLTQAQDDDSTVQMTYDSLSRVLTEVQGGNPLGTTGKTVSYAWDAEGNRTQVAYPSGFEANETRDELGRLTQIEDGASATVASFEVYGAGLREKKRTLANGTCAATSYDGFRRPTAIDHKTSGGTEFAGFDYGWDKNDNPLYEARSHTSGKGDVYSYDKANRLTRVLRDVHDPAAEIANPGTEAYDKKLEYEMDDVLNLTSYKQTPYGGSTTTTSYTTDAMNQYTAIGSQSLTYTDAGSLADDGTKLYEYDAHEHLIAVRSKSTNAVIATYSYDALGLGRRIGKVVGSETTRYVHAGVQAVEEYDGTTSAANLRRLYVFGERIDQVVAMDAPDTSDIDQDQNTTEVLRLSFHTQLIGSVTQVTGPSGSVVESYEYDPYGKPTIKDGGGSTISASAIGNSYLFTARQLDAETGLYHYRARAYSPELRRFIQRDPLEYVDGPNAYTYVRQRPTIMTDHSGQCTHKVVKIEYTPSSNPDPKKAAEENKKAANDKIAAHNSDKNTKPEDKIDPETAKELVGAVGETCDVDGDGKPDDYNGDGVPDFTMGAATTKTSVKFKGTLKGDTQKVVGKCVACVIAHYILVPAGAPQKLIDHEKGHNDKSDEAVKEFNDAQSEETIDPADAAKKGEDGSNDLAARDAEKQKKYDKDTNHGTK